MKRFSINLASRPFRNNTLHWTALAVVVALLTAFTWYNVSTYRTAEGDLDRWMNALQEHRKVIADMDRDIARMKSDVSGLDLVAFSERSAFANEIILSRLFSWTSLFDRLEQVMPPKVRLRSIRPSLGKEMIEITIDGMTPDHSALLDFEEALIDSEYFTFVYPLQESSKVKQGEINFSVTFGYLPEGGDAAQVPFPFDDAPMVAEAAQPEAVPPDEAAEQAAPPAADSGKPGPPEAAGPRQAPPEVTGPEGAAAGSREGKAPPPQVAPARPSAGAPSKAKSKAKSKAGGVRPPRPARAKRPPAPAPDLPDESAGQAAGGSDPNGGDPNASDPNDGVDPNDGGDGGRP